MKYNTNSGIQILEGNFLSRQFFPPKQWVLVSECVNDWEGIDGVGCQLFSCRVFYCDSLCDFWIWIYHFWGLSYWCRLLHSCRGSQIQHMDMAGGLMEKMNGFPSLIYPWWWFTFILYKRTTNCWEDQPWIDLLHLDH